MLKYFIAVRCENNSQHFLANGRPLKTLSTTPPQSQTLHPNLFRARESSPKVTDDLQEVRNATLGSPVGRMPTSGRPARVNRDRPTSATNSRASRSFPGSPIGSPREHTGAPSGDGIEEIVKTPFDVAKHVFDLLFLQVDEDRSGCVDSAEFGKMLRELGREISPNVVRHCLARYAL